MIPPDSVHGYYRLDSDGAYIWDAEAQRYVPIASLSADAWAAREADGVLRYQPLVRYYAKQALGQTLGFETVTVSGEELYRFTEATAHTQPGTTAAILLNVNAAKRSMRNNNAACNGTVLAWTRSLEAGSFDEWRLLGLSPPRAVALTGRPEVVYEVIETDEGLEVRIPIADIYAQADLMGSVDPEELSVWIPFVFEPDASRLTSENVKKICREYSLTFTMQTQSRESEATSP